MVCVGARVRKAWNKSRTDSHRSRSSCGDHSSIHFWIYSGARKQSTVGPHDGYYVDVVLHSSVPYKARFYWRLAVRTRPLRHLLRRSNEQPINLTTLVEMCAREGGQTGRTARYPGIFQAPASSCCQPRIAGQGKGGDDQEKWQSDCLRYGNG